MLDARQVKAALRQRAPFLMLDEILEIEDGKRVVGVKKMAADEPFFRGHFPGEPIVPGVMIIEAAAQTASFLFYDRRGKTGKLDVRLGVVKEMRFCKPVYPGARLVITAETIRMAASSAAARVVVSVDGDVVSSGELIFVRGVKK